MTRLRSLIVLVAGVALLVVPAGPAEADSASSGGDVAVAQTLGDRDLTMILRRVTSVPGPLRVEAITHAGTPGGSLTLTLTSAPGDTPAAAPGDTPAVTSGGTPVAASGGTPVAASGGTPVATSGGTPVAASGGTPVAASGGTPGSRATLALGSDPGSYGTTMRVDRAGPWELAVGDGVRTARVPFVVLGPSVSPAEKAVYGGFLAAGLLLLVTIVVAVRVRHSGWVLLPGAGLVAGLAVAITGAVLSASLPLPPQPGLQTDATAGNAADQYALSRPLIADYSRPPVLMSLGHAPDGDLSLRLSDASTGLPVDDLVVHDSALIHLLIVGPGARLWHLHPIRVAPGSFEVHFEAPVDGHYAVSAELERRGGGVQLVRAADGLDVGGAVSRGSPAYGMAGVTAGRRVTTTVSGVPVSILASGSVAGAAVTLTVGFGTSATLQPWLGMLGHLIVVGPVPAGSAEPLGVAAQRAPVWAHAHSMGDLTPGMNMPGMSSGTAGSMSGSMAGSMSGLMPVNGDSAADETVAAYGPSISFTFTFSSPGRYLLWIQAERDYRILTVPAALEVTP